MCEVFYAGHRRVKVIILTFPSNNVNKILLGWIRESTWLFEANKKAEHGPAFVLWFKLAERYAPGIVNSCPG
jgi:hypothetical protein